jgi:ABC-2 type transport system ATP-binding protein
LLKIKEGKQSNDVLKYLLKENVNIIAYNEVLPSLNDIFIKLVEGTHATARAFQTL